MENRLQYILLIGFSAVFFTPVVVNAQTGIDNKKTKVDSEFLEFGLNLGIVNIEDFPSEYAIGTNLTFRATEDFFLQLNYMQTDDVDASSAESEGATEFIGEGEREFQHYNLLLGYNLFQGEFFTADSKANLSSFHLVAGVGETEFGGEGSFTYIIGFGYKVAFNRRYIVNFDVRDYLYQSSLVADDNTVNNIHTSIGFSYLF